MSDPVTGYISSTVSLNVYIEPVEPDTSFYSYVPARGVASADTSPHVQSILTNPQGIPAALRPRLDGGRTAVCHLAKEPPTGWHGDTGIPAAAH